MQSYADMLEFWRERKWKTKHLCSMVVFPILMSCFPASSLTLRGIDFIESRRRERFVQSLLRKYTIDVLWTRFFAYLGNRNINKISETKSTQKSHHTNTHTHNNIYSLWCEARMKISRNKHQMNNSSILNCE